MSIKARTSLSITHSKLNENYKSISSLILKYTLAVKDNDFLITIICQTIKLALG